MTAASDPKVSSPIDPSVSPTGTTNSAKARPNLRSSLPVRSHWRQNAMMPA
jgi:hypothetical protein